MFKPAPGITYDALKTYLGSPNLDVISNFKDYKPGEFNPDNFITYGTKVRSLHFDKDLPQVFNNKFTFTSITDATSYFHWMNAVEYETWSIQQEGYTPTIGFQGNFDPSTYNIVEYQLKLNSDSIGFSRSCYQLLNLIGDSGGIDTAVFWLGGLIVSYVWSFHIQARIANKLY